MKTSYSKIQKMTLAAMLIALAGVFTIISKVISVPGLRSISINLAPAITMFGSLTLGPFYGILIGVCGDLIGLLYPTGAYNFFYTLIAALYGLLPYLLSLLTRLMRKKVNFFWIIVALLVLIAGGLVATLYATDVFDYYISRDFGSEAISWMKPLLLVIFLLLLAGLGVGLYFSNRYFNKQKNDKQDVPTPNECGLICLVCDLLLGVIGRAGALAYYFGVIAGSSTILYNSFPYLLLYMGMAAPVSIFIDSFLVSWLMIFFYRFASHQGKIITPEKEPAPEIDYSLLSEEEKEEMKVKIPMGWVIFFAVLIVLIVISIIVVVCLGDASDPNGYSSSSSVALFVETFFNQLI